MGWLYSKTVYRDGEHTDVKFFGGAVHANMSTNLNPGIWFIYFGKMLRLTVSRSDDLGLALKKRPGFIYYHFLRWSGQLGWSFPWKKYAVKGHCKN